MALVYILLFPFYDRTSLVSVFMGVSHLLHKKNLSDHGFLNFANFI